MVNKIGYWKFVERMESCYDIEGIHTWAVKVKCSSCGFITHRVQNHGEYRFCPQCGAKMVLLSPEEVKKILEDIKIQYSDEKILYSIDFAIKCINILKKIETYSTNVLYTTNDCSEDSRMAYKNILDIINDGLGGEN